MLTWEGKRGEQVPVWTTDASNRLYKLVPLSAEGGARLSDAARLLDSAPDLLAALEQIAGLRPLVSGQRQGFKHEPMCGCDHEQDDPWCQVGIARAAIRKAKGE